MNDELQYQKYVPRARYEPGDVVLKNGAPQIMDGTRTWVRGESLPKMNIDLLEQIVHWAKESRTVKVNAWQNFKGAFKNLLWTQDTWGHSANLSDANYCGTNCCIAGAAVLAAGLAEQPKDGYMFMTPQVYTGYNGETVKIKRENWHEAGAAVLGLTANEAASLFSGSNNLGMVKSRVQKFAQARGEYIEV